MDRRGQPRRPNNQEADENGAGWGALFGLVAAAGAAVAAGAYLVSQRIEESSTSSSSSTTTSSPGMPQRVTENSSSSSYSRMVHSNPGVKHSVILAVDATPTQGGGILRMSIGVRKILYFYSVNWSEYFKFPQQSDKFEMINALLALLALKQQIQNLKQESWENLVIKVDNNFVITLRYLDPEDNAVLQRFKTELTALSGTAEQISQRYDNDMENANQLSKGGADAWVRSKLQENYAGYRITDVSDEVMSFVEKMLNIVPRKYHVF